MRRNIIGRQQNSIINSWHNLHEKWIETIYLFLILNFASAEYGNIHKKFEIKNPVKY